MAEYTYEYFEKLLKKQKATDLKRFWEVVSVVLSSNMDFIIVADVDKEDCGKIIEEMLEKKIPFTYNTVISWADMEIFKEIRSLGDAKVLKAQRVDLLAKVLSSDVLFEGFCLSFPEDNEMLQHYLEQFGVADRFTELTEDSIYMNRKEYALTLTKYVEAAVNLYGAIHITDMLEVIKHYENTPSNGEGYARQSGGYQNTFLFNPEWLCVFTLSELSGSMMKECRMSMDGILLNVIFEDEVAEEMEEIFTRASYLDHTPDEDEYEELFAPMDEGACYREMLLEAYDKPFYLPEKEEFLKYSDFCYRDISSEEEAFKRFLKKKYSKNFTRKAKLLNATCDECIESFMDSIFDYIRAEDSFGYLDTDEYLEFIMDGMDRVGISYRNMDTLDQFMKYAMGFYNGTRLWSNRGYSPKELALLEGKKRKNGKSGKGGASMPTIVPMSSMAAQMLEEGREDIEEMGFSIDLDATVSSRKIYPNDPCPCGSGKKYKKCCGKN